jgi:cellulose synthase/poly-beta-1,6-N-acetylglucosamine synthase-like glycosyltransferase
MGAVTLIFFCLSLVLGVMAVLPWLVFFVLISKRIIARYFKKNDFKKRIIPVPLSVSVIVPFHGEWSLIGDCLSSIAEQDFKGPIKTFIGAKKENIKRLKQLIQALNLTRFEFEIVESDFDEKSHKLNLCIKKIQTNLVAFLDADHIADALWIRNSVELLEANSSWGGVQSKRRPIIKKGIVYSWDSFVNHVGNEFFNKMRLSSGANVPFTGTSAIFWIDVFRDCLFESSMTEDTDWYFRRTFEFEKKSLRIGYAGDFGTRELMAQTLMTLISRRIRWSTGHTKSFVDLYKKNKWSIVKSYEDFFHGIYFTTSVPFVFFVFINQMFFFLQMNPSVQIAITLASLLCSSGLRFVDNLIFSRFWINFIFSYIVLIFVVLVLSGFTNVGLDVIVSRVSLVMLPGSMLLFNLGAIGFYSFLFSAMLCTRKTVPFSFKLKSIVFSAFYIPIEVMTSFIGTFRSFSDRRGHWMTSRSQRRGLYEVVTLCLLVMGLFSSFWILMDGRGAQAFFEDTTAIWSQQSYEKKQISFSPNNKIHGIALNVPPNNEIIKRFSEIGVNAFRFYKDPGIKWINTAYQQGLVSTIQPSFSNWDHVDVRRPWSRSYLKWNLFYLDSKYRNNPAVSFIVLGNEIELWAISNEKEEHEKLKIADDFFKIFQEMQDDLVRASHYFTNASTIIDVTTSSPVLLPNMLTTSPFFWENYAGLSQTTNKLMIAGEWGGFQAPDDAPPDWLRSYRTELQWEFLDKAQFSGGFFFASTDNSSQPIMDSYNDPLNDENPEDRRGALDKNNQPKEIYWNLAFLYSPLRVVKKGGEFYLLNRSSKVFYDLDLGSGIPKRAQFGPNEKIVITNIILSTPEEDRYAEYRDSNGGIRRILYFHYPGRLTGCLSKAHGTEFKKGTVYVADYENINKVKLTGGELHFSGQVGQIEIHPKVRDWSISGIKAHTLRILSECRAPFYTKE